MARHGETFADLALVQVSSLQVPDNKRTGGEGGIRTLDTGFGPYNGLAIVSSDVTPRNPNHLHSH
jgi:hypothetical protein